MKHWDFFLGSFLGELPIYQLIFLPDHSPAVTYNSLAYARVTADFCPHPWFIIIVFLIKIATRGPTVPNVQDTDTHTNRI